MSAAVPRVHPVDEILPLQRLILLGLQHVLVMAASPITAVFLIGKTLNLASDITVNLISATFLMCGLGSLLQSLGPFKFGARLPFIMVPGGAPIVIFLTIAQQTDIQTASGAVILTALFYFAFLPVFALRGLLSKARDRHDAAAGRHQSRQGLWRNHHRHGRLAGFRRPRKRRAGTVHG